MFLGDGQRGTSDLTMKRIDGHQATASNDRSSR
jgi:hypothetical protein